MMKFLLAILTGLVGAAALHILVILVLPLYTGSDVWSKLEALGTQFEFYVLPNAPNDIGLYNDDDYIQTAVCRLSIDDGPVQILADRPMDMWTFSLFDTDANEIFSMSARSAIEGKVDFLILSRAQLLELKSEEPELLSETISIEISDSEGYGILRLIAPNKSEISQARKFLSATLCTPL